MIKRLTLFLIDDDPDDQRFFLMAAKRIHGAIVCAFADDGPTALLMLADPNFIPDLIFIDINMPIMNGIECLREIKKNKLLEAVPTYMYSTSADSNITASCIALGANGAVKKIPNIAVLSETISNVMSKVMLKVK